MPAMLPECRFLCGLVGWRIVARPPLVLWRSAGLPLQPMPPAMRLARKLLWPPKCRLLRRNYGAHLCGK